MFKLEIKQSETLHTRYGTTKIKNTGYYQITSRKEGNHGKLLHRLIFEDMYGPIPEGCHIHHKDGNKLNNCIKNLQLLTGKQHNSMHQKGKSLSEETKRKISEAKKGGNNPKYWLGKFGVDHGCWNPYARVVKNGFTRNREQQYGLKYNGNIIKVSRNKEMLEIIADDINQGE